MHRRTFLACLAVLPLSFATLSRAETFEQLAQEAERRKQAYLAQLRDLASKQPAEVFQNSLDIVLGPARANKTVLVFTDFNCPYCRSLDSVLQQLAGPEVRFVLKWQTMMGDTSAYAAHYALQVWRHRRSKYLDVHNALMQAPQPLSEYDIRNIARSTATYHLLPKDEALPQTLQNSVQLGEQLRVFATPTMLVGARMMGGMVDAETLAAAIQEWPMDTP
ncbi:thioredoxin domain-containing protein [Chitinibacter sp. SCUT-21]|uniref:DsbA family protein n=1 Tax=Chitinibacter sp. SCUT-21 TaxID=2970891 RepID=UPI0035A6E41B